MRDYLAGWRRLLKGVPRTKLELHDLWRFTVAEIGLVWEMGPLTYLKSAHVFSKSCRRLRRCFGQRVRKGRLDIYALEKLFGLRWALSEASGARPGILITLTEGDRLLVFDHAGQVIFDDFIRPSYGWRSGYRHRVVWVQNGYDVERWCEMFLHGNQGFDAAECPKASERQPYRAIVVLANQH